MTMQSTSKLLSKTVPVVMLGFFLLPGINSVFAQQGKDKGYYFIGPEIETSREEFTDGKYLMHHTYEVVVISENPSTPWHDGM